jgi:mRNA-degrading endonuclease RelE of RelBE toxin-antitoxin system
MADWQFSFKPTFLHELQSFEPKESAQVLKKIELLAQDPTPDAKTKKQLRHLGGKLHRLRSGDFRIFYAFREPFISLLSVKRRNEQTYEDDVEAKDLGGADIPEIAAQPHDEVWTQWLAQPAKRGTPLATIAARGRVGRDELTPRRIEAKTLRGRSPAARGREAPDKSAAAARRTGAAEALRLKESCEDAFFTAGSHIDKARPAARPPGCVSAVSRRAGDLRAGASLLGGRPLGRTTRAWTGYSPVLLATI